MSIFNGFFAFILENRIGKSYIVTIIIEVRFYQSVFFSFTKVPFNL